MFTYDRATDGSGRILSYTTKSHIEDLFDHKLNENSFRHLKKSLNVERPNRTFLFQDIFNRGYDLDYVSKKTKISKKKLENFFKDNKKNLNLKKLKKICNIINTNPADYIDRQFKQDKVGKYYFDYKDSIKTIRKFKSYEVASIACSARDPDLTGYFIKVKNNTKKSILDLIDSNCSHYLVTKGKVNFFSIENKKLNKIKMKEGESIWVASYTAHGFSDTGALIKISDGQNFNYLEKIDLTNTYNLKMTLKRGRKDKVNWGYDTK